jgi:hypothetical protein
MLAGALARTRIRCPAAASAAIECEPTYPVPPVTSTRNPMYPRTFCVSPFSELLHQVCVDGVASWDSARLR